LVGFEHTFAYNPVVNLWLLLPRRDVLARPTHPWTPPYSKTFGVLARAETETDARRLAQAKAGNEGLGVYQELGLPEDQVASDVWLDPAWTSCDVPEAAGEPGVILVVRHEG
jgi:hypothetical protein